MEGETASYIERPPNPVQQHLQDVVAGFAPGAGGDGQLHRATPRPCAAAPSGHGSRLCSWWRGETASHRGVDVRWAHRLPGKPTEGHTPHHPFDKITSWGPRQVCRKARVSVSEAGTGRAGDGQRAREQPSGVGWSSTTLPGCPWKQVCRPSSF